MLRTKYHQFQGVKANYLSKLLRWAEKLFIKHKLFFGHGSINAWDEAVFIASYILKVDLHQVTLKEQLLSRSDKNAFIKIVLTRLKTKQPLGYIIKQAWFAGKKYYIDRRVIIPRSPFAELVQAKFQPWLKIIPNRILDLCTGSGCIAIACYYAFAKNFPLIQIDASDISTQALEVAKKNLTLHQLTNKINLIQSNLFRSISTNNKYDLIISNPPYVDLKTFNRLPTEFYFEPKIALLSGETGMEILDQILSHADKFLSEQGILIVEIGYLCRKIQHFYPKLNFNWIKLKNGGEGIFVLTKQQLVNYNKKLN